MYSFTKKSKAQYYFLIEISNYSYLLACYPLFNQVKVSSKKKQKENPFKRNLATRTVEVII